MKISLNWLKSYIKLTQSPEEIGNILTDIGLEVEGIEEIESIPGGLEGLVIGEVLECVKHPNADKLKITKVDLGLEEPVQIVCGAPNVDKGQKVVVATVNTTIFPLNGESFKIKKAKIRGEESRGMICAEDEIGLGQSHDGIIVLPADVKVGTLAADYYKIEKDIVFEIGLTPNRVDASSHIGVARDLAAFYRSSVTWPKIETQTAEVKNNTQVEVKDLEACPRYAGINVSGIKVAESPDWLKKSLTAIGLAPINNVVDVTNFVLHEMGQPLHAFDVATISNNKIIVQKLKEGINFKALDGNDLKLSDEDLMISDDKGGLCIAGVFGGVNSGVSAKTTDVFIESAYFNPVSVRKTAKRHGLNTDASFRFERGVDPSLALTAMNRAAQLIQEVAGGIISNKFIDIYPKEFSKPVFPFSLKRLNSVAGKVIEKETVVDILKHLEMGVKEISEEVLELEIPLYRVDVLREIDVIEEVLRIYGFNNIEIPAKLNASITIKPSPDKEALRNTVSDLLVSNGFCEMMANSLSSSQMHENLGLLSNEVYMANPLSSELNILRTDLIVGSLDAVAYNLNRQVERIKLFEFGKSYQVSETGFNETNHLTITLAGKKEGDSWVGKEEEQNFYSIKKSVIQCLAKLGINDYVETKSSASYLSNGISLERGNKELVIFGEVSKKALTHFKIKQPVFYAKFNWDLLVKRKAKIKTLYTEIAKFPSVKRDLSLLIDSEIEFQSLEKIALKHGGKILKKVSIFDVYNGDKLPKGKKSYALNFELQDVEQTLTDKKIEFTMNKLMEAYKKEVNADIRM